MLPCFNKTVSPCGISYYQHGSGPYLFLIHGVGLRGESWYQYVEPLSQDFTVVIPDLPGHGSSQALPVAYGQVLLGDYTQALTKFASSLSNQPFYVCGHSLGSLIAIEMASLQANQILGLAALNAIYQRSDQAYQAVQARAKLLHESDCVVGVEQTIKRWFGQVPDEHQHEYMPLCVEWLQTCDLAGYAMAYKTFADQRGPSNEMLDLITCPSVYITGALDFNSSAHMTMQLAERSAQSEAAVIENAGHMMPLTHFNYVVEHLLKLKRIDR